MSYFLTSKYYYSSVIRCRKFSGKQDMLQEAIAKPQDFPIRFPLRELSWGPDRAGRGISSGSAWRSAEPSQGQRAESYVSGTENIWRLAIYFNQHGLKDI
jgi:hypothetical protein